ncbi:MAG TPA: SDR family oxidoreductase [Miltoncostaeaceae bacterium]|nr:SDR family oxidoreductase [Miltoncostaeaceae bacterium]
MRTADLFDLSGCAAIVTGGGRGIGRQMATALAEQGADVVVCSRKLDRCEEAAAELEGLGVRALAMRCDAREPDQVAEVVRRTTEELGGVDVLVNNAGATWGAPPEEVPLDAWRKVVDVNLTGVFVFCQEAGRAMIARGGGGRILNVASIAGMRGFPAGVVDALPYSASKGGVIALTQDLACKWARHGIRVNALAPGWFPSDMSSAVLADRGDAIVGRIPLGRLGGEDDLKGAVAFLASRASDFVTGQTLIVDGGESAW